MKAKSTAAPSSITAAEAVANLPSSIRIGPYDYLIEALSETEVERHGRWGDCWPGRCVIRIAPSIPNAVKVAETFLHECVHAIFHWMGVHPEDKEERTVTQLGTGLTQLYRDNPWLLGWLAECLAP